MASNGVNESGGETLYNTRLLFGADRGEIVLRFKTADVLGLKVFYREAGDPDNTGVRRGCGGRERKIKNNVTIGSLSASHGADEAEVGMPATAPRQLYWREDR